jgi:hypothetical protein
MQARLNHAQSGDRGGVRHDRLWNYLHIGKMVVPSGRIVISEALREFGPLASDASECADVHLPSDLFCCDDCVEELQDPSARRLAAMTAAIALLYVSAVCFGGAFLFVAVENLKPDRRVAIALKCAILAAGGAAIANQLLP